MGIFDLSQITQWKETFLLSAKNQEEDFCQIAAIHAIADIKDEQLLLELNEHMKGCKQSKGCRNVFICIRICMPKQYYFGSNFSGKIQSWI